jgi:hypothetical protein
MSPEAPRPDPPDGPGRNRFVAAMSRFLLSPDASPAPASAIAGRAAGQLAGPGRPHVHAIGLGCVQVCTLALGGANLHPAG